jgi:antitoxin component HigA of HigAB toxin-antitoxin module
MEQLKQAVEEVNYLRTLHFRNGEFTAWKDRVCQMLESAYGKESLEYKRFINAPGKAFIVRTEMGQTEEYHQRLDCYEAALKSLIN